MISENGCGLLRQCDIRVEQYPEMLVVSINTLWITAEDFKIQCTWTSAICFSTALILVMKFSCNFEMKTVLKICVNLLVGYDILAGICTINNLKHTEYDFKDFS